MTGYASRLWSWAGADGTWPTAPSAATRDFVGGVEELRQLRVQLTGGVVGVVTAVHGIGGMGKTELAVTSSRRRRGVRRDDGCAVAALATST